MKERLGVILVREGLITPEQRDQALESQILSGGRLGTNLVDMKLLTVDQVGHYLSVQHGLPVAGYDGLAAVPPEVVERVPKAHCARYKVFPLSADEKVLHLAMLDPDDLVAIDELTFLLGLRIQPYVVPQLRLLQVLERRHGFMRERRFLRIADEEETGGGEQPALKSKRRSGVGSRISTLLPAVKPDPAASPAKQGKPLKHVATRLGTGEARPPRAAPQRGGAAAGEPPPQASPAAEEETETELVMLDEVPRFPAEETPAPEKDDGIQVLVEEPDEDATEVMEGRPEAETAVVPASDLARALEAAGADAEGIDDDEAETSVLPVGSVARPAAEGEDATVVVQDRLSLGAMKTAATAMERAEDRDAIIDLLVHPFRYQPVLGVLFLIRGEMAVGLSASSGEVSPEEVRGLALPLATPSLLKEAFQRQAVVRGAAADDPMQQVISRYLRWGDPDETCVAPIRHGDRVINLLCVQSRKGIRFPEEMIDELEQLCETAAKSYVRLIQHHKRPVPREQAAAEDRPGETEAPDRPNLPEQRFFLTGYVGREGPVEVWRAIDTKSQRVASLKLLERGTLREDQVKDLPKLVRVLVKLRQPHILHLLAAGVCDDGRPYLVTPYVGDHTLRTRLERQPTPPHPEVAEIVRQLGEAINAAHFVNVTHGDLCPENVLFPVPDKLQLKLGGFGMPRGIPAGLPRPESARYMAPEGLGKPGTKTTPADIYSLAAMTYELLGGKLPIAGETLLNPPELPPMLPGVPQKALNVIARGLAQQPSQRPTIKELVVELFTVLRGSTG